MALADQPKPEPGPEEQKLEQLMRRYQQADEAAAAALIARLSPQLFRFFLSQVRDRSQAEDLLQDFWLRMHHAARHTYRPGEPVLPWVYAIARRVQTDAYRRRSRIIKHEFPGEKLPDLPAAVTNSPESANVQPGVNELLARLPPAQRETVLLLKVAGLSLEEVARSTGTSIGAVKQRAHRAYVTLRRMFGNES
jgi:RNA polymerase sigma-70 factor, ECF subfamily